MKMIMTIAWRNIWRNPVRSVVIIISVMVGLWAGTFINALYYGMGEDRVRIAIENEVSHIQIHHPEFKDDYKAYFFISLDSVQTALHSQADIAAYSPRSLAQGMLATASSSTGITINGVDANREDSSTHLSSKIIEGSYFSDDKPNQILVGYKLAKKLNLKLKSKVVLSCLDKADNIVSGAFKVAGIYQSGNSARDGMNVFILRSDFNNMVGLKNQAHEIAILLKSNQALENTKAELQKALPNLKVDTWKEVSPETDLIISTLSQFSIIFIVIILLALSFGILNTMLMAILERTREIGMMIALGMNQIRVFFLILFETFMLVMIGCPLGLLVAWITINYFSKHGIDISSFASQAMSSFGFSPVMYPSLPLEVYIQIILIVIVGAILSAVVPAIKALRINPADSLKQ